MPNLDQLERELGVTPAGLCNLAIEYFSVIHEQQKKGNRMAFVDGQGNLVRQADGSTTITLEIKQNENHN